MALARINRRTAFTLVELLITLGIIAIVIALTVGGVQKVRAAAAQAQCGNHLKQIGLACHAAHDVHKRMPPAFGFFPGKNIYNGTTGLGNVFFHLLPHLDQQALYQQGRTQTPPPRDFFLYTASGVHQTPLALYQCPADPTLRPGVDPVMHYAPSSYAGNYLVFGQVEANFDNKNAQGRPQLQASFLDGTSQTILFAEKYAAAADLFYKGGCLWAYFQANCYNPFFAYYEPPHVGGSPVLDANAVGPSGAADPRDGRFQVRPSATRCNPCLPATGHATMNACMADGSVRGLAAGLDRLAWWALVTPAANDLP